MSADRCFQEQIGRLTLLALEVGGRSGWVGGGLVEDGPGPSWTLARGLEFLTEQDMQLVTEPAAARPARSLRCGRDRRVARDDERSAGLAGEGGADAGVGEQPVDDVDEGRAVVVAELVEVGDAFAE